MTPTLAFAIGFLVAHVFWGCVAAFWFWRLTRVHEETHRIISDGMKRETEQMLASLARDRWN